MLNLRGKENNDVAILADFDITETFAAANRQLILKYQSPQIISLGLSASLLCTEIVSGIQLN